MLEINPLNLQSKQTRDLIIYMYDCVHVMLYFISQGKETRGFIQFRTFIAIVYNTAGTDRRELTQSDAKYIREIKCPCKE